MTEFEQSRANSQITSPRFLRWLALWTVVLLALGLVALVFVPWQQTVIGKGKVTAFSPMLRPQSIEAQLTGRLRAWRVMEGQSVEAGQVIAELADLDPKFLNTEQLSVLEAQNQALIARKAAAQSRIMSLESQLAALGQSRQSAVPGAGEKVAQNQERIFAMQQALQAAQQNQQATLANLNRIKALYEKGLRSQRDLELAQLDNVRAETGMQQAEVQMRVSQREMQVSQFDRGKVSADTTAAMASVAAAVASAQETVASVSSDIAKLEVDIENLKSRTALRQVKAPVTGTVVRLLPLGVGETVTEGDILAVVVPKKQDQAVELYISDWDVPLVSKGRIVRLQFAGWPAIQFSGWPVVASGTFGGRVAVVDAVDDGKGRYRILIKPDLKAIESGHDQPWPSGNYLRPGTEATGWILLNQVPLGYELWRQFNAFPPSLKEAPEGGEAKSEGAEKPVKRKPKK